MATAREYFEKSVLMEFGTEMSLQGEDFQLLVSIKIVYDFDGGSKYIKIYIPETPYPDVALTAVLSNFSQVWEAEGGLQIESGIVGGDEKITRSSLRFTGRILVWTAAIIDNARWDHLKAQMESTGYSLLVRDGAYAKLRDKYETPAAFISHDSRDKDALVRALANKMQSMLCPVWYDEFTLRPGDSLRESIEKGLKTCSKCVVVLSKNFFSNPGWSKREFDIIYTREIVEGRRLMIPIWLDVTKQEVFDYSPLLVDTLGIPASLGIDEIAKNLFRALDYTPPVR